MSRGPLHHVELWVPDLGRAIASIGWLLEALGYEKFQDWDDGRSWRFGGTYIVVEQSPALTDSIHDRQRPGLNHLAFHSGLSCSGLVTTPAEVAEEGSGLGGDAGLGGHLLGADGDSG
jgi:hypothetical protein